MHDLPHFATKNDLVAAWRERLKDLDLAKPHILLDQDVASDMVYYGMRFQDHPTNRMFEDDPRLEEVFDLVARLEVPDTVLGYDDISRRKTWERVRELMIQLEMAYPLEKN